MDHDIAALFPELAAIEDATLRDGVRRAWELALADYGGDPAAHPWLPPGRRDEYPGTVTLVGHVRDVVAVATAMTETFVERGYGIDPDVVLAGALVHDVSKPVEFGHDAVSEVGRRIGHPRYGVHLAAAAGLPTSVQHIVVSHSRKTAIDPATPEAVVVAHADETVSALTRQGVRPDER